MGHRQCQRKRGWLEQRRVVGRLVKRELRGDQRLVERLGQQRRQQRVVLPIGRLLLPIGRLPRLCKAGQRRQAERLLLRAQVERAGQEGDGRQTARRELPVLG